MLLFVVVIGAKAQMKEPEKKKAATKWLYGCAVEADAASIITATLLKAETYTMQGGIQLNLVNKYFPVLELGYAGADKLTANNVAYMTNAPFGKIGLDFNLLKQKPEAPSAANLLLIGLRLGASNFNYDITNISISDGYWKGSETINYLHQPSTNYWFELSAGIQVEVVKNIYLGWRVRNKKLLGTPKSGALTPWYIPGFGINNGNQWEFNYNVGFKI